MKKKYHQSILREYLHVMNSKKKEKYGDKCLRMFYIVKVGKNTKRYFYLTRSLSKKR